MAGIPDKVLARAKEKAAEMEESLNEKVSKLTI